MDGGIITATIERFSELSGIGRSRAYQLLADGSLESIYLESLRLIARQRAAARERGAAAPQSAAPQQRPQ